MRPYAGGYRAGADRGNADIAAPAFLNQCLCQRIGSILGCAVGAVFGLGTVSCSRENIDNMGLRQKQ